MIESMHQNTPGTVQLNDQGSESGSSSSRQVGFLVPLQGLQLSDSDPIWIQAFPYGQWDHPVYGDIEMTPQRASRMAAGVKNRVRGQDLPIDYDHRGDAAKGSKAAGWIRDAEARNDGFYLAVNFTDTAREEIEQGEWRYFSPEYRDEWEHPSSGETHKDVLFGGGLTNRPFLKGILPINLSEAFDAAGAAAKTQEGGKAVEREELIQLLGLSEDASDEDIQKALKQLSEGGEVLTKVRKSLKLSEDDDVLEALSEATKDPESKEDPEPTKLSEEALSTMSLSELAEASPAVKELVTTVAKLEGDNIEKDIDKKLSEMREGNRVLSPAQKEQIKKSLLRAPKELHEDLLEPYQDLLKQGGGVKLSTDGPGGEPIDPEGATATKKFNDRVAELIGNANDNLSYGDAVAMAASEDPDMYNAYRRESYSREEV